MGQIKSWEVSDALWERLAPFVPLRERNARRKYKRKAGGGRKPMPDKQAFAGMVYVLRTGCQWKALPKEYGSSSSVHARFVEWQAAGFFRAIWQLGLAEYDELEGVAWKWQSIDGAQGKAPMATECVGPNPTDRGKKRTQAQPAGRRSWSPAVPRRRRREQA